MVYRIIVPAYSDALRILTFDPESTPPTLKLSSSTPSGKNPSWISPHPTRPEFVFAANELTEGKVKLFKLTDSGLELLDEAESGGADPAHLAITESELLIANYSGGTFHAIPYSLENPPRFLVPPHPPVKFEGSGPQKDRQEASHPHQVVVHNEEVLIPDLGADKVWRLSKNAEGRWTIQGEVLSEKGGGPRHIMIHDGVLYILNELSNVLSAHTFPSAAEESKPLSSLSTLKEPHPGMTAAELLLTQASSSYPSPYLYASNRNDPSTHGDTISIFSLPSSTLSDPTNFSHVAEIPTGLKHVRGIAFGGPENKYLIVGGAQGGGIKVYERVDQGKGLKEIAALGEKEGPENPTGFVWV